jgi:hypothetical protein
LLLLLGDWKKSLFFFFFFFSFLFVMTGEGLFLTFLLPLLPVSAQAGYLTLSFKKEGGEVFHVRISRSADGELALCVPAAHSASLTLCSCASSALAGRRLLKRRRSSHVPDARRVGAQQAENAQNAAAGRRDLTCLARSTCVQMIEANQRPRSTQRFVHCGSACVRRRGDWRGAGGRPAVTWSTTGRFDWKVGSLSDTVSAMRRASGRKRAGGLARARFASDADAGDLRTSSERAWLGVDSGARCCCSCASCACGSASMSL